MLDQANLRPGGQSVDAPTHALQNSEQRDDDGQDHLHGQKHQREHEHGAGHGNHHGYALKDDPWSGEEYLKNPRL